MWRRIFSRRETREPGGAGPAASDTPPSAPPGPAVSRHALRELAARERGGTEWVTVPRSGVRPGATLLRLVVPVAPWALAPASASEELAALVLVGAPGAAGIGPLAAGDLLVAPPGEGLALESGGPHGAIVLLDVASGSRAGETEREVSRRVRRIGRDDLVGAGFAGVSGARTLCRTGAFSAIRLGPPPAARWVLVGLRSFAVFTGKLTVMDADAPFDVLAGECAVVADPTVPLHLQAGNDAAIAVAFGDPGVRIALG